MTPAVTANALMRLARVERSTSTRISHTPEKQANAARRVLDCVDKWPIDLHLNWRWFWPRNRRCSHHYYRGGCGGFGSFFVHGDEGLVKDIGDVEVIIRLAGRDLTEIRAALRNIECAFHSKRLKLFCERDGRRFKFELWQMQIDVLLFEFCAFRQKVRGELRFQCTQTIYVAGKKNEKLEIVAGVGNADRGEAFAPGVTKSRRFPHHRNIDRRAAADVECSRLR